MTHITVRLTAADQRGLDKIASSLRDDLLRPNVNRSEALRAAIQIAAKSASGPHPAG